MLISVSGSQGSGKSVTLNHLKQLGYEVVERKSSRSIQKDWGKSLEEINGNRDLTLKFQDEIISRKLSDEMSAIRSEKIIFTERSYADLFTYALAVLGKENQNFEWLNQYYDRCKQLQQGYAAVFYLKGGHFPVEPDPMRAAINPHYSRMIDITMLDITSKMTNNNKLVVIDVPQIEDRLSIIQSHINKLTQHDR